MKIGLTYTGNEDKHQNYVRWLEAGGNVDVIRLSVDEGNLDELDSCDALVLSGGIDIHPQFYNSQITDYPGAPENFQAERDMFEIAAYNLAQENKVPVLGICRGMQLINVIHHGTLVQDHADELVGKEHVGNPDRTHKISIEQNSFLHDIIGEKNATVNSAHHQAIAQLGEGLVVNATSSSGNIVEGIELADPFGKPFLLAVQWHPERMYTFDLEDSPASKALRDSFISAIKKSIASKK
ncbi:MAG: gamma-glutamyl-gamma-aminobutyrate hydrolase family protein [Chitinophagaceae bacterium]